MSAAWPNRFTQALNDLKSSDKRLHQRTADQLGHHPPADEPTRDIARRLESLAGNEDVFVRRNAVKALGLWGTTESIEVLVGLLDHKDTFTHGEAIHALAYFVPDERAVAGLANCLPNFFGRAEAVAALKAAGPAAEKYVRKYVGDKDRGVNNDAIAILFK